VPRATLAVLAFLAFLPAAAVAAPRSSPDGRYSGRLVTSKGEKSAMKVTFHVARRGRRITKLKTTVSARCVGPTIFDRRTAILTVHIPRIAVGARGRFKGSYKPLKRSEFKYEGTRRGRRVRGHLKVTKANCRGWRTGFRARRVGR
jgi:hypothetical protein